MAKKTQAIKDLERLVKGVTSLRNMRSIGQLSVKIIKDRTRNKGQGVAKPGGQLVKLKSVSPEYAKWREKKRKHPKAAKNRQSNLTLTGALINKLKIVKLRRGELFIGWKDTLNQMKALGQEKQGRPFLYLSASELSTVKKDFEVIVEKLSRKI